MVEKKTRLLVVDDDIQMTIALEKSLAMEGYQVDTADNVQDALAKLATGNYQGIISDIRMDGLSGLDLLKKVKSSFPDTHMIMMTAYGTINTAIEAMKIGAADFLLKPFSVDDLLAVINRVIGGNELREAAEIPKDLEIITRSPVMEKILNMARQVANSRASILVQAESGTGKELLARYIHSYSSRSSQRYVAVNCAAVPKELLESELFGHEKGSFTGAITRKIGKFEFAHRGTLVLDEISEMDPLLQAKILRVLQEQEIDRVGSQKPIPIDVRIIATTNQDLVSLIKHDKFREDLYYRLNVIPMSLPPLRERPEDILPLAEHFCKKYGKENNREYLSLAPETENVLALYHWPGNVRELENIIHRAVVVCEGEIIRSKHLFLESNVANARTDIEIKPGVSMRETEKQLILKTLKATNNNRTHAAKLLGISIRTLRNKLREYRENDGLIIE